MTRERIARITRALMLTGFAAAAIYLILTLFRGEWNEFAVWLGQLPATLKHPGRRRAFLSAWLLPLAGAYLLALSAGIFWGLRRVEIDRQ